MILRKLRRYVPDLDDRIAKAVREVKGRIDEEVEGVRRNAALSESEKRAWESNILSMRDYMVQREINKTVYHAAVDVLSDELVKGHFRLIEIPMIGHFHHVVKSLEAALERHNPPATLRSEVVETPKGVVLRMEIEAS